ncbi:MAG: ATP-binding protein [Anaerolineae bacterium]
MIIAVASGKGGTGKTTVAVGLALSLLESPPPDASGIAMVDCDVEAPNAALFLKPDLELEEPVELLIPKVDLDTCVLCGECAEACQYHALAVVGEKVLVFEDLCHGCGSCARICPVGAITEVPYRIGTVAKGRVGSMRFVHGHLDIGRPMAVPIIRQEKHAVDGYGDGGVVVVDAPPGAACPAVAAMRGADFVLLVTEPTPFGLHDLKAAVQVARDELGIPVGVVINRDSIGDDGVERYCAEEEIPILLRIPFDRRVAESYADGAPITQALPELKDAFLELFDTMRKVVS